MPTKWLSRRHRHPASHNHSNSYSAPNYRQDFDFPFQEQSSSVFSGPGRNRAVVTSRPVDIRPTTAGAPTGRRRQRAPVPATRPETSDNHKPMPMQVSNVMLRSDDGLIGLAFGSPSHPPQSFCTPSMESVPLELNPTLRHNHPSPDKSAQMQSRKWRKLGSLFKSREAVVRRDEVPPGPTIGLPTGLVMLDKSPTSQSRILDAHKLQPIQSDSRQGDTPSSLDKKPAANLEVPEKMGIKSGDDMISRPSTATDANIQSELHRRPPLPKLELEIPTEPLDRFSVMFRNLPAATRSSSLLARRSKTLRSLKSFEDIAPMTGPDKDNYMPHSTTESLTPLMPPRLLTTPTRARSPAGCKYSLFPTTSSTPVKNPGHGATLENGGRGRSQLKRSMTSPARLSPMQDHFAAAKPKPLNLLKRTSSSEHVDTKSGVNGRISNEQIVSSPEDNTASTDREAPWSSTHSFQSSLSSATTVDEIFFDIKSFRDSKGVEDGQFVMTRPASAAIHLARTRSKRAGPTYRIRRPEDAPSDEVDEPSTPLPPPMPSATLSVISAGTTKHTSVNTAYFDEAIAAVELLTSPTATAESERILPITFASPRPGIFAHKEPSGAAPSTDTSSPSARNQSTDPLTSHANLTREEVGQLIPSPVTEVREDLSQYSASEYTVTPSSTPVPPHTQPEAKIRALVSPQIAAAKRVDRPIDDSPTIPQGPPSLRHTPTGTSSPASADDKPPPVPTKDAKYIPLSKYAAKNTVFKIEQAGITPTRPLRTNTDSSFNVSHPPQAATPGNKERSATLPSSLRPPRPPAEASSPSSALRGLEKTVPPPPSSRSNPRSAQPAPIKAEVAVARTISLSRKQSARVHVPGPKLGVRRAEAAARQQRRHSHQQKRSESEPPKPSMMGGHRHRRTGSRSVSKDKIMSFIRGEQSDSDKEKERQREREREKERARLQIEKQVAIREKAKEKEREKEREKEKDRSRETPVVTRIHDNDDDDSNDLSPQTRKWEMIDKSKWEILEKKAYSPVVVQAQRGHRPGLSVGVVVEDV
ncbi:hypothetical protein A1O1_03516 [Capronia coronata CBS 617.96]|uniref:Uncharacterized protein n=1 Tax=Capronia coronata CBS 617.96 TaxID=1182541 RepID=W9YL83_9EURO|nr:uncharacterized protein A1O1_03516 [Capronia coronata CBS 617.96]EXJ90415.1 hypothetical protein A1O1_03516 [Capronia coronata CBS 617.96]